VLTLALLPEADAHRLVLRAVSFKQVAKDNRVCLLVRMRPVGRGCAAGRGARARASACTNMLLLWRGRGHTDAVHEPLWFESTTMCGRFGCAITGLVVRQL